MAPGGFVLKGGTSLSKGYAIINRFSEDVDILVVPHASESAARGAARLKTLTENVAESLGLSWEAARDPGHGRSPSRGDNLRYPATHGAGFGSTINTDAILFETRIAGGDTPSEMCVIRPLIAGRRGLDPTEFEDLAAIRIRVLDPMRTASRWSCCRLQSNGRHSRPSSNASKTSATCSEVPGTTAKISRTHLSCSNPWRAGRDSNPRPRD